MSRDPVEPVTLSTIFASLATVATVPLGHHVCELFSLLAVGLAILGLGIVCASAARGAGTWRPTPWGAGIDAAGLLATLAASSAPIAEHRAGLVAFAAIAAGARISDGYRPKEGGT